MRDSLRELQQATEWPEVTSQFHVQEARQIQHGDTSQVMERVKVADESCAIFKIRLDQPLQSHEGPEVAS
eukprot:CAMPEP_0197411476 /NCGR_PEP_ID=MMETSP1165-20131217/31981_1 /TAXON_ID=284809 /ORGANISM="Chrysocystis fragilis, Strain CCMP3189" /LENGTH=69 /DNA_ID=CAMNT_0042937991 /DNA_START=646 /DNA_END=856 /DNA_ORIENTATION=+